jgi:hypothetical protein
MRVKPLTAHPPVSTADPSSCAAQTLGWGTQPAVADEFSPGIVQAAPQYVNVTPARPCYHSVTFTINAAAVTGYDVRYIEAPLQPLNPHATDALPLPGGNDPKLRIIIKARPNGQFSPGTVLNNQFAGGRFYTLGRAEDGRSTGYALAPPAGQLLTVRSFKVTRGAVAGGYAVTIAIMP